MLGTEDLVRSTIEMDTLTGASRKDQTGLNLCRTCFVVCYSISYWDDSGKCRMWPQNLTDQGSIIRDHPLEVCGDGGLGQMKISI